MKALVTPNGTFGPFESVEVGTDRYHCDGTDLPFIVVGAGTVVAADTITWPAPPAPPALPVDKASTLAELEDIDKKSIRAMREWIAAQPSAPQILKDHEAKAAATRAKLK